MGLYKDQCDHCEGTGNYWNKPCGACNGSGSEKVRRQLQKLYNANNGLPIYYNVNNKQLDQ